MGTGDDLMGLAVPIVEIGLLTGMTKSMFSDGSQKEKVRYRTVVKKVYVKRKKAHAKRLKTMHKDVKKYL